MTTESLKEAMIEFHCREVAGRTEVTIDPIHVCKLVTAGLAEPVKRGDMHVYRLTPAGVARVKALGAAA